VTIEEIGKNLDEFGRLFETLDDSQNIADGDSEAFHGRFGGVDGTIEFTEGMFDFFEEEDDLDANNGSDGGQDGNSDQADDLGQGHGFSIASYWLTMVMGMTLVVVREKRLVTETLISF